MYNAQHYWNVMTSEVEISTIQNITQKWKLRMFQLKDISEFWEKKLKEEDSIKPDQIRPWA